MLGACGYTGMIRSRPYLQQNRRADKILTWGVNRIQDQGLCVCMSVCSVAINPLAGRTSVAPFSLANLL